MDKTSFNDTLYSFPKIIGKENSTFYKTFYSNGAKTTKSGFNLKLTPSSTTNLIQRNTPISSYSNYTSQLKNNINIKNRNRKYTILIKRRSSLSSEETDDTFFAYSEIKHMDNKILKRTKKASVWKQKHKNLYDMYASANKKDIEQIRKNIREYELSSDFDLKAEINKKKYFPLEKVQTIYEATDIMNKLKKIMTNEKKAYEAFFKKNQTDLNTFVGQNREICKKNFVIDLIRSEREKIKIKEKEIKRDLEDAKKIFYKDKAAFDKFTDDKKKQFRKTDLYLDSIIRNNKILNERIKKYGSDVHETENEMIRCIKGIILYKSYADFIHKLLNKESIKVDLRNVKNNIQSKDKDLVEVVRNVIGQFNFLLISKEIPVKTEEINNPDLLTALFFSLEGNIIHQMRERDEILKEKFNEKKIFDEEILNLKEKLEINKRKYNILSEELNLSKNIYLTDDYQLRINEASEFIYEISEELLKTSFNKTDNKMPISSVIEASLSLLKKNEDTINNLFNEINEIKKSDSRAEELLKEIYNEIKLNNKLQKQKEGRKALKDLEEEKNLKYLKKNYRYKVRGPIVYPPPWVLERKKIKEDNKDKNEINEEEMLYYDK